MEIAVLLVGLLVFLAHLFAAMFERTRVPDILPLVGIGLLIGPILRLVTPESLGQVGMVFSQISLGVILFETGLDLDFSMLRRSMKDGVRLTVINFAATVVVLAAAMVATGRLSWLEGLMLGSILGGTSSAVVVPVTRMLPVKEDSRTILILESTFSDVLTIGGTLALIQAFRFHELRPGLMLGQILAAFAVACLLGFVGGLFWANILKRVRELEHSIFTTPAFVFVIYGVSEALGFSGAIAALAFGITLGNVDDIHQHLPLLKAQEIRPQRLSKSDKSLFGEVVFLLKTFFAVYIGVSIQFNSVWLFAAGFGLVCLVYALRIPVVLLSLDRLTPRFDASVAAVLVPKGLAAAVLASLPLHAGIPGGQLLQDVVYSVILFSITGACVLSFLLENHRLDGAFAWLLARFPAGEASSPRDRSVSVQPR